MFINLGLTAGYQWFWNNGFNLLVSYGKTLLISTNRQENINITETADVVDFLDKNTKNNQHGAYGIIFGWLF